METYSTPVKAENAATAAALLVKKVEYSPNSLAKCKSCQNKIQKRSVRIGIPVWYARYQKYQYHYYHLECCPDNIRSTVPNIHQTLIQQKQTENEKYQIVHGIRHELRQQLKRLRLTFAKHLKIAPYCIFKDVVLDEIVFMLPETNNQLLNISGIGPTKLQNFGTPILSIIRQYKNKQRIVDYDVDEDSNSIAIGETLTCEQLVQQKFDHAAANGYIIEI